MTETDIIPNPSPSEGAATYARRTLVADENGRMKCRLVFHPQLRKFRPSWERPTEPAVESVP